MSNTPGWRVDRLAGFDDDGKVEVRSGDDHDQPTRTPFERDVDRIKYTRELRRLKDVTQVARSGESYLYHDRLSHSMKVAQVGRRMAEFLLRRTAALDLDEAATELEISHRLVEGDGLEEVDPDLRRQVNPDAVEAACFAHDMGHPPFGHVAERELDILLQDKTNESFDRNDPEFPESYDPAPGESGASDVINAYDEVAERGDPEGLRFEGNAQSFRILTRLGAHRESDAGLWLTLGTLNGVLKYPYGRGEWVDRERIDQGHGANTYEDFSSGKFGFYETERRVFQRIREETGLGTRRSLTAEIMDYADDLTYAIHDMTDFYKDGRFPLDRLLREAVGSDSVERRELDEVEKELGYADADETVTTPTEVLKYLGAKTYQIAGSVFDQYTGSRRQRMALEGLTSHLVTTYINEAYESEEPSDEDLYFTLEEENGDYHLVVSEVLEKHIDILQELTRYYVLEDSALMAQQSGQRRLLRELFEALYEESAADNLQNSALPESQRELLREASGDESQEDVDLRPVLGEMNYEWCRARVVADFIASMTEPQAIDLHRRLTGSSLGSLQNRIVR